MIRVIIPHHLRTLARTGKEVSLQVETPVTQRTILDALEHEYPMLRGTIRDHSTKQRRPFIRFFACGQDLSHEPLDTPVPEAVVAGSEPFMIIGAMAGGNQLPDDLPLTIARPARRALLAAGYTTLEQLSKVQEKEIMQLHGVGPKALDQLHKALAEKGLSFGKPPS